MDRLNFNHLFYFYVIAKEGSIKASAEKLHVSQPTISDQLKLLEEFLDSKLFERKNRGLHLTKEGALALEYAEELFGTSQEMVARLRHKERLPKRSLDIGITHFMTHFFLYDTILPLFKQSGTSVNVKESERHLLLADLEEGQLDIVYTDSKEGISKSMSAFRVGVNRTYAVAHKKFSKYRKKFPEGLGEIPFFNYTNDSFLKYEIEMFYSKNSITPRVVGEGDDMDLFQVIVENAIAFVIVPEPAKNRLMNHKDIILLGEIEDFQTSVWGIVKKDYRGLGYKLLKGQL